MISTRPLISKTSSPYTNPLVIVPRAPIIIGINIPFMFHSFFCKVEVLILLFTFLRLYPVVSPLFSRFSFFYWQSLSLIVQLRSICISKSQKTLCISFSWTDSELCIYHLFTLPNLKFLHNSQRMTFLIQLCLVLYSFGANLPHSLIM